MEGKGLAKTAMKCSQGVLKWMVPSPREGGEVSTSKTKLAETQAEAAVSNVMLGVAAAAGGVALLATGYYYWINSEIEDGEGSASDQEPNTSEGMSEEDAKADSEAALQQAREALKVEWEQAAELKRVSEGKLGFEAWWTAADENSKKSLLQSARQLMRQRLLQHQPDAATALDVLCPEIGDQKLDRIIKGNALVALIKLRITQIDAVRKHDVNFVRENLAKQNLEGSIQGVDAVEVLCDNRQLLMMTFLCDVLILCRHMGNFPTMLK